MIDFRYHLVSIVSIFVALSVGIVLGAGPLQGGIGTQLTDQVSQLRDDMETLRTQRDDYAKSIAAQDDYATEVNAAALAGRLTGQSVVVLVSPDASGTFAERTITALQQAGATVTARVTLTDAYRAADNSAKRLTAATAAASSLGLTAGTDADALLSQVLAAALVHQPTQASEGTGEGTTPTPSSTRTVAPTGPATALPGGRAALEVLRSAGLIDVTTENPARAGTAVVLGGQLAGTTDAVASQTRTLSALLRALDGGSGGVVVATGAPTSAATATASTTLVTAVRADSRLAAAVSSVDHADSVVGSGVIVLTMVEQESGTAGHYGTSADAKADVPTVS